MWGQPRNPFGGDLIPPIDLGVPPLRMPPMAPMAAAVQAQPHGFLREGGPGRTIIGIIADALAGATGGQGTYAPLMLQKRREQMLDERDIREEERKARAPIRSQIGDDYVEIDPTTGASKVLYHGTPKAQTPDELTRLLDAAGINDPTERQRYYRQKADAFVAPPMVSAPGFDEQGNPVVRLFPRTGTPSGPPPAAVAYLKVHPEQASAFEQKYGPGSASTYLGGPTPQASGTFR